MDLKLPVIHFRHLSKPAHPVGIESLSDDYSIIVS